MNKVGDISDHGNVQLTEADYLYREDTETCHDGTLYHGMQEYNNYLFATGRNCFSYWFSILVPLFIHETSFSYTQKQVLGFLFYKYKYFSASFPE